MKNKKVPNLGTSLRKSGRPEGSIPFSAVMKAFKQVMREQKRSYSELAKQVGLSESGLKKIFGGQDASYSRICEIARALNIRLTDLLAEIDSTESVSVQFSPFQQEALMKNPVLFQLFMKIAIERETLDEVKRVLHLSESELFRALKKLDGLKLLQLLPHNKVRLPPLAQVKNFGSGPLLSKIYQEWGQKLIRDIARPENQATGQFIVRGFRLKPESYEELLDRLLKLEAEFLKRAIREMSVSSDKAKPVRWMWLTDQNSFIDQQFLS